MAILDVTDATFEKEVLQSPLPVLIDLHADWCAPCKQLKPIVAQVAEELAGKIRVVAIDVDHNPRIAESFRVQSIPMLVLVYEGAVAGHLMGLVEKKAILDLVKPVLPKSVAEMAPKELAQLLATHRVVPVDVREAGAFNRYRIPHAQNIPADVLVTRASELAPTDGRVRVLYGRSTDEAKSLAETLRTNGVDVAFLQGGFLHWEADGFEIERGN
ncbi:MAG: thioredoxin family protein [Sandaracinaceae bacterium]|jgi:thioredoxin 1|nr:thioredoxin family protein [Sandaracinaceae bacterium]